MNTLHPARNRNSPAEGSKIGGKMPYDIQPSGRKSLKVTRMDGDNAFVEAVNVRGQILILKKGCEILFVKQ